ncbi:MAG: hypothetical protein J6V15_07930, partial [Clostridia bacterium]|nr:hypothetical protein [Clostridia bacterium]
FSDYLKRYIYRKSFPGKSYGEIPLEEYRNTLIALFKDNQTPSGFDENSTKLTAAVKNWLSRPLVSRRTVLLLGFGMAMTTAEVNDFLTKGICEQKLNPKDPMEVICRYCYSNRLGYYDFCELMAEYCELQPGIRYRDSFDDSMTNELSVSVQALETKKDLMEYLAHIKDASGVSKYSRTLKRKFMELYNETRLLIAKGQGHSDYDSITLTDVEHTIFAGVPIDETSRNLFKEAECDLEVLYGKRLSRTRIGRILGRNQHGSQETEVNRYDLITLNFFIFSQKIDTYPSVRERFNAFYEATNNILRECFMHELIIQNPFENFILSCMLSEDPLDTFESVWEKSYHKGII